LFDKTKIIDEAYFIYKSLVSLPEGEKR